MPIRRAGSNVVAAHKDGQGFDSAIDGQAREASLCRVARS